MVISRKPNQGLFFGKTSTLPTIGRGFGPGGRGKPRERAFQSSNDRRQTKETTQTTTGIRVVYAGTNELAVSMMQAIPSYGGSLVHLYILYFRHHLSTLATCRSFGSGHSLGRVVGGPQCWLFGVSCTSREREPRQISLVGWRVPMWCELWVPCQCCRFDFASGKRRSIHTVTAAIASEDVAHGWERARLV